MKVSSIHPSAVVAEDAHIGPGTRVWHFVQVREGARVGADCVLGKGVYVGEGVEIGDRVKVENGVSIFSGATIEDGVFIGPHVCFTNDRYPRAINPDGSPKSADDWQVGTILVRYGASVGAGSVLIAGVTIGRWALVAAGSVVTRDVPDHGLVSGNPARLVGHVCFRAHRLTAGESGRLVCGRCGSSFVTRPDGTVRAE